MKLTMEQAAQVIGKTKKTIYNHRDANKFSWDTNDEGVMVVDASEILRVYGEDEPIPTRLKQLQEEGSVNGSEITQDYTPKRTSKNPTMSDEEYRELIKLREENKYKEKRIEDLEQDKEKWQNLASDAQNSVQKMTLLLEDQREKKDGSDKWGETLEALERRLANQDEEAKKRLENEDALKAENLKMRRIAKKQQQALKEEREKSWLKKLFG